MTFFIFCCAIILNLVSIFLLLSPLIIQEQYWNFYLHWILLPAKAVCYANTAFSCRNQNLSSAGITAPATSQGPQVRQLLEGCKKRQCFLYPWGIWSICWPEKLKSLLNSVWRRTGLHSCYELRCWNTWRNWIKIIFFKICHSLLYLASLRSLTLKPDAPLCTCNECARKAHTL